MRRTLLFCAVAVVAFSLGTLSGPPAAQAVAAPAPHATPAPAPEPHPEIRPAIHSLEEAQNHLEKAARDFGGRRVKALEHTRETLVERHEALEFVEHY